MIQFICKYFQPPCLYRLAKTLYTRTMRQDHERELREDHERGQYRMDTIQYSTVHWPNGTLAATILPLGLCAASRLYILCPKYLVIGK